MSGKHSFCLPPGNRTAEVRSPIVLENKYFLPMFNIQYHLFLEAFLTHGSSYLLPPLHFSC